MSHSFLPKNFEVSTLADSDNDSDDEVPTSNLVIQLPSFEENTNGNQLDNNANKIPVTPIKVESEVLEDPLTPTANLKMLLNAISPEIRNREILMGLNQADENEDDALKRDVFAGSPKPAIPGMRDLIAAMNNVRAPYIIPRESYPEMLESKLPYSRKVKSLSLLSQKFIEKFPDFPDPADRIIICLDDIAKELGVERRRIYDIVNVLESVEIVSRLAKNSYRWHGKVQLADTLKDLQALSIAEGYHLRIKHIRAEELRREYEDFLDLEKPGPPPVIDYNKDKDRSNIALQAARSMLRKDKSLGIMSQKFLMLFLVCEPKVISLDLAARMLIGDPNSENYDKSKYKTKIRRLYDIANILTTVNLIEKVYIAELRGRKPAFRYTGPDIGVFSDDQAEVVLKRNTPEVHVKHSVLGMLNFKDNVKKDTSLTEVQPGVFTNGGGFKYHDKKLPAGGFKYYDRKLPGKDSLSPKNNAKKPKKRQVCSEFDRAELEKYISKENHQKSPMNDSGISSLEVSLEEMPLFKVVHPGEIERQIPKRDHKRLVTKHTIQGGTILSNMISNVESKNDSSKIDFVIDKSKRGTVHRMKLNGSISQTVVRVDREKVQNAINSVEDMKREPLVLNHNINKMAPTTLRIVDLPFSTLKRTYPADIRQKIKKVRLSPESEQSVQETQIITRYDVQSSRSSAAFHSSFQIKDKCLSRPSPRALHTEPMFQSTPSPAPVKEEILADTDLAEPLKSPNSRKMDLKVTVNVSSGSKDVQVIKYPISVVPRNPNLPAPKLTMSLLNSKKNFIQIPTGQKNVKIPLNMVSPNGTPQAITTLPTGLKTPESRPDSPSGEFSTPKSSESQNESGYMTPVGENLVYKSYVQNGTYIFSKTSGSKFVPIRRLDMPVDK